MTMLMTILVCDCNADAACNMHAEELYARPDTADTAGEEAHRSFLDATADFYIPGWTPDDEDSREHDRKIVADMEEEVEYDPLYDSYDAVAVVYGYTKGVSLNAEVYTADDLASDIKADTKGEDL